MNEKKHDRWIKVDEVWRIIERLRSDSGCPWDRKQTPETIQTYLVEESHEAAAAIRGGEREEAAEELGDVLFMVLFLVYLYEQQGDFGLDDVCSRISEKMIRRHPHVFGEVTVNTAEEVKDNWEKIKADEKSSAGKTAEPVPESLPALMRAYRILARQPQSENSGWSDLKVQAQSFAVKSRELLEAVNDNKSVPPELIGDMLLRLVNIARIKGIRAEDALHDGVRRLE
ncbi:MAG: MazG family protein [Syntrophobacteraceae bacterium]